MAMEAAMSYDEPFGHECGEGWKTIINDTHRKLKYLDSNYKIAQIKEKFGGLRYYYDTSLEYTNTVSQIMEDVVRAAEEKASRTCDKCGTSDYKDKVDLRIHRGFYYTNCEECSNKMIEEHEAYFKEKS
jgi:hypothetical protein